MLIGFFQRPLAYKKVSIKNLKSHFILINKQAVSKKLTRPVGIVVWDRFSRRNLLSDDYLADLVALTTDEETVFGVFDTDSLKVEIFDRSVVVCSDFSDGAAVSFLD